MRTNHLGSSRTNDDGPGLTNDIGFSAEVSTAVSSTAAFRCDARPAGRNEAILRTSPNRPALIPLAAALRLARLAVNNAMPLLYFVAAS